MERSKTFARLGLPLADAGLFALVIAIVGMMIVPLPTWLLDLLLASNLALAMLLLITALRVPAGIAFSTLPTVLLITTLYRLALNVSSTRLILLQADAGRVIQAFGEFVVQGNYAVGAVVFLIITIIQYLVVAKGSERIAEVGARFSLDALPGKQLAIDADLRAGALSPEAARRRRAALERESQFYGAMDGAMKFVKGDAIAGIAIAALCFAGGSAIGALMHGRSWAEAVRSYGLLAIGDALVSQIPSLVISTAAGLVVTRVAEHEQAQSLGQDIAAQLFAAPAALAATAGFVLVLGLVPGLPALPFVILALLFGGAAVQRRRVERAAAGSEPARGRPAPRVVLALGAAPSPAERARLESRLASAADSCRRRLGLPGLRCAVRPDASLAPDAYVLVIRQAPIQRGTFESIATLARDLPADLDAQLSRHARELLDLQDVQAMLDELTVRTPALAKGALAKAGSLPQLTELLRRLLDEGVSLHARERLFEGLLAAPDRDPQRQLNQLRRALREQIVGARLEQQQLHVHRLDPLIEDAIREAVVVRDGDHALALKPDLAADIIRAARVSLAASPRGNLLTQSDIRRCVFELLAPELPTVTVLSYDEIPAATPIQEGDPVRP